MKSWDVFFLLEIFIFFFLKFCLLFVTIVFLLNFNWLFIFIYFYQQSHYLSCLKKNHLKMSCLMIRLNLITFFFDFFWFLPFFRFYINRPSFFLIIFLFIIQLLIFFLLSTFFIVIFFFTIFINFKFKAFLFIFVLIITLISSFPPLIEAVELFFLIIIFVFDS